VWPQHSLPLLLQPLLLWWPAPRSNGHHQTCHRNTGSTTHTATSRVTRVAQQPSCPLQQSTIKLLYEVCTIHIHKQLTHNVQRPSSSAAASNLHIMDVASKMTSVLALLGDHTTVVGQFGQSPPLPDSNSFQYGICCGKSWCCLQACQCHSLFPSGCDPHGFCQPV
jgi:hypothetical protein